MPTSRSATIPRSSATRTVPSESTRSAVETLGDWYALGAIAIDRSVAGLDSGAAGVARLWPEHFDLGTDVEVAPGRRCNLGASPGDEWHPEPYLYVGPWGDERPGDDGYWNAPFGAVRGYADIVDSDSPVGRGDRVLRRRHPSPAEVERT